MSSTRKRHKVSESAQRVPISGTSTCPARSKDGAVADRAAANASAVPPAASARRHRSRRSACRSAQGRREPADLGSRTTEQQSLLSGIGRTTTNRYGSDEAASQKTGRIAIRNTAQHIIQWQAPDNGAQRTCPHESSLPADVSMSKRGESKAERQRMKGRRRPHRVSRERLRVAAVRGALQQFVLSVVRVRVPHTETPAREGHTRMALR
jgi:hypothetical protein